MSRIQSEELADGDAKAWTDLVAEERQVDHHREEQ